ncbi:MAG: UDP-N-acetyl-D-mannosamine dehydrogenase [Pseudoclavibacter sp.]
MNPTRASQDAIGSVCVVGLGYIGLPTAAFIASKGLSVIGVDVNEAVVEQVNRGDLPFFEPDFEATLAGVVSQGRLVAQLEVPEADAFIVAVPTPFTEGHNADPSFIFAAADAIAPKLRGGELVVLESTSPPGMTERLAERIRERRPDLAADDRPESVVFAHCPERVLPGRIMVEMATNDRIIGGLSPRGSELAKQLYSTFCSGELLMTDARTAEMAKLSENSFRDVNIAFANELSLVCERLGIDVWELIELANHHPRVNILQPGPGVGGQCIAVDPWFIVSAAPQEARLIEMARLVNDSKPGVVLKQVFAHAEGRERPTIATLGVTFKANVDDLRESPAKDIAIELAKRLDDGHVLIAEPNIHELPGELARFRNVELTGVDDAIERADIVLVLVEHDEFTRVDRARLEGRAIVDTKGIWR